MARKCVCASAISAEMTDWVRLGGGNSGCCGNAAHTYGFHVPASALSVRDYSRRHEAAAPFHMDWACAGDFAHNNNPNLRALHAKVLARLMRGELPMICEFIGKPWPGKPVYYWARWNGVGNLARYTGSGHDHWSHISWWRSRANQRAYLWVTPPAPAKPTPAKPAPAKSAIPAYPGYVLKYAPTRYNGHVKTWQARMRARGWTITADGYFGAKTLDVVKRFQREKRLRADGLIGPVTWRAAWVAPVTK